MKSPTKQEPAKTSGGKLCPISSSFCNLEKCAWYLEDEGRCAIASLPTVLDWLTRITVAKPYEAVEKGGSE